MESIQCHLVIVLEFWCESNLCAYFVCVQCTLCMRKIGPGSVTSYLIINCYIVCRSASLCSHTIQSVSPLTWHAMNTFLHFSKFFVILRNNKHFVSDEMPTCFVNTHTQSFDGVRGKHFIGTVKILLRAWMTVNISWMKLQKDFRWNYFNQTKYSFQLKIHWMIPRNGVALFRHISIQSEENFFENVWKEFFCQWLLRESVFDIQNCAFMKAQQKKSNLNDSP